MTASLRKAAPRRTHKERSQLSSRAHLGLLEKKKDYKLRSKDYNRKQKQLVALKQKAQFRNPDEFYFGMIKNTPKQQNETKFTNEELLLMKSQDVKYVEMQRNVNLKKIEKLENDVHVRQAPRTHIKFDSPSGSSGGKPSADPSTQQSTSSGKAAISNSEEEDFIPLTETRKEIQKRTKLNEKLGKIQKEMELKKLLSGKGRKQKIEKDGKVLYKWAAVRQK